MAKAKDAPPISKELLDHLHCHADQLRVRVGAGNEESVDAFEIAKSFDARIEYFDGLDAKDISGASIVENGILKIALNRNQTPERMNVTLLEEICHYYYRHQPEKLDAQGRQQFNAKNEQEAKQTAAAILLPAVVVAKTVFQRNSIEDVASAYGASVELFMMRVKVLGLWDLFKSEVAA
ncbi:hypothetical protein DESA109040_12935 [Deinococcus saxicola]|uniref:ImmA/IrrE family metallo-endopeptidase n=1 Tax=Deinococcus saxicola TaxID=249406 RepID=UPI0039EE19B6